MYLCLQCQNLLKNKKKRENDLLKASQSIESKVLSMDLLPEESVRTQPPVSHEMISVPPDADVIVRLFKLPCTIYCLFTHRYWIVIKRPRK